MTDKQEHNPIDPGLFDTQQLLRGVDPPPEGSFRLEDILAEYAGDSPAAPAPEAPPESVPEERPPVSSGEGAAPLPPPDGDFWDGLFAVAPSGSRRRNPRQSRSRSPRRNPRAVRSRPRRNQLAAGRPRRNRPRPGRRRHPLLPSRSSPRRKRRRTPPCPWRTSSPTPWTR